jgi:hypothetical protein
MRKLERPREEGGGEDRCDKELLTSMTHFKHCDSCGSVETVLDLGTETEHRYFSQDRN